ncbi:hypothetical protein BKA62DRAFT_809004 [Auriculariales sp. MPI-PUGE-AT-0066]|nr:hypothetical protein BKA62DRAFT_809004 [Auriculariales sp. MPI-PUGE-AT-0066]
MEQILQLSTVYLSTSTGQDALCTALDQTSKALAVSINLREQIGATDGSRLWSTLALLWKELAQGSLDGADGIDVPPCLSLARFTRNLVAGVPSNQQLAYDLFEGHLVAILFALSSYIALHDELLLPTTRMLVQTLSNIVTTNEALLSQFWSTLVGMEESRNVLIRLLQAEDERTIHSTLVLLNNVLSGSSTRRHGLVTTPIGKRLLVLLLDATQRLFDAEQPADTSINAPTQYSLPSGGAFDVAYALFSDILLAGDAPSVWEALRPQ